MISKNDAFPVLILFTSVLILTSCKLLPSSCLCIYLYFIIIFTTTKPNCIIRDYAARHA